MYPWSNGGFSQVAFIMLMMASILTVQSKVTNLVVGSTSLQNIAQSKNLQRVSANDNEPGGLCNMSDPCNTSAGGCRAWEKCVNGSCLDTTNGGANTPSADSCGGGGGNGGSNPTNTPVPTSGGGTSGGDACRDLTLGGTFWDADCAKSCVQNSDCPKRTQGDTDPPTSNWCYGFSNGKYCMMRDQNHSGGGGGGTIPSPTHSSGGSGGGCFSLAADVNKSLENGKYKFEVSVKFVSLGGDGDVKLDRDGRHVAGWNAWNRNTKTIYTYSPEWTGGAIRSSGSTTFVGTVANSAACPNVTSSMSCSFNVDDGSCNCGGAGNCNAETPATATPRPANTSPSSTVSLAVSPSRVATSPSPTPSCQPQRVRCPNTNLCVPSLVECEGIPTNTPTPTKIPSSRSLTVSPTISPTPKPPPTIPNSEINITNVDGEVKIDQIVLSIGPGRGCNYGINSVECLFAKYLKIDSKIALEFSNSTYFESKLISKNVDGGTYYFRPTVPIDGTKAISLQLIEILDENDKVIEVIYIKPPK